MFGSPGVSWIPHRRRVAARWKWFPSFHQPLQLGLGGDMLDETGRAGLLRLAKEALGIADLDLHQRIFGEVERGLAALLAPLFGVAGLGCREDLRGLHLAEEEADD